MRLCIIINKFSAGNGGDSDGAGGDDDSKEGSSYSYPVRILWYLMEYYCISYIQIKSENSTGSAWNIMLVIVSNCIRLCSLCCHLLFSVSQALADHVIWTIMALFVATVMIPEIRNDYRTSTFVPFFVPLYAVIAIKFACDKLIGKFESYPLIYVPCATYSFYFFVYTAMNDILFSIQDTKENVFRIIEKEENRIDSPLLEIAQRKYWVDINFITGRTNEKSIPQLMELMDVIMEHDRKDLGQLVRYYKMMNRVMTHSSELMWRKPCGTTFLHQLVQRNDVPERMVETVIEKYPNATVAKSGELKLLPLHHTLMFFCICSNARGDDALGYYSGKELNIYPTGPRTLKELLSDRNLEISSYLIRANPDATLNLQRRGVVDPWTCVCTFWGNPIKPQLKHNLIQLTMMLLQARYVARHGRSVKFLPLHALLSEDRQGIYHADNIMAYFLSRYKKEASMLDHQRRLCLHIALEKGIYKWGRHNRIQGLCKAAMDALVTRDATTHFHPFMTAAVGEKADLYTVFIMLKSRPEVLNAYVAKVD